MPPGPSTRTSSHVGVRGLTGSLSSYDVDQAMHGRSEAFLACVEARPARYGWIGGEVRFHFEVDASGQITHTHLTHSDLGYAELENCLVEVATETRLPKPAGSNATEVGWNMSVAPLDGEPQGLEAEHEPALRDAILRHAESTFEACEIPRDQRFVVTGYLARNARIIVASASPPWQGTTDTHRDPKQLSCLNDTLQQWKGLPRTEGLRKLSFELQWAKAPQTPEPRASAKPRRSQR